MEHCAPLQCIGHTPRETYAPPRPYPHECGSPNAFHCMPKTALLRNAVGAPSDHCSDSARTCALCLEGKLYRAQAREARLLFAAADQPFLSPPTTNNRRRAALTLTSRILLRVRGGNERRCGGRHGIGGSPTFRHS